jgi:arylsulfatase B/arylsulfatase I/J
MRLRAVAAAAAAALLAAPSSAPAGTGPAHPHIFFILADDYGFNDVGYHENAVSGPNPSGAHTTSAVAGAPATPTIDQLAREGCRLEMYYVQPLCSPTRGTIMTGRYPSHTGIGPNVIRPVSPYAMPKDEVLIPQLLKKVGYATHAVGKWHLGYCDERYSPLYRGFDSFCGYLNGAEDYWQHTRADSGFSGLDFRNGSGTDVLPPSHNSSWGVYSSVIFGQEVARIATHHGATAAKSTPLFVYFPFQSVHAPLQAPESYLQEYKEVNDTARKKTCAMISAMDDAVAVALAGYKSAGLWDDTVTVFSTDNGGPLGATGDHNNYPLRSGKAHNWEGGVRGVGWVRGTNSGLAKVPAGSVTHELMHTTDWLPTLVSLAGGSTVGTRPLDGFDSWDVISKGAKSHRRIIAHNVPKTGYAGALRLGPHKLLLLGASSSSIPGMQTTVGAKQVPPPGFAGNPNDVVPEPFVCPPAVCKHGAPPVPRAPVPASCSDALEQLCGAEHVDGEDACLHCTANYGLKLAGAHCSEDAPSVWCVGDPNNTTEVRSESQVYRLFVSAE